MIADEMLLLESAKRVAAQMAIVDMSIGHKDGFGAVRRLRKVCPTMKLIVISAHNEISVIQSALAAGADGFVLKRTIATDLLPAMDAVRAGQRFVSPSTLNKP